MIAQLRGVSLHHKIVPQVFQPGQWGEGCCTHMNESRTQSQTDIIQLLYRCFSLGSGGRGVGGMVGLVPLQVSLVLQCVAVRCSVLQYVAWCCSVLQCVAVCFSVLQCVVVFCTALHCIAVCCVCCSVLQRVATCCSVLQRIAACCSVLQCEAYFTRVRATFNRDRK